MGNPIVPDIGLLKSRYPAKLDGVADQLLALVVQAATDHIEARTGRIFVEDTVSVVLNGNDARGKCREILPPLCPPVSGVPVVTENGVALAVTTGYDANGEYDVVVDPGEAHKVGKMYRTPRGRASTRDRVGLGWAEGIRNITADYTGAAFPNSQAPQDIQSACVELSYLLWQVAAKAGATESRQMSNFSSRAARDLSAPSKAIIDSYILWGAL